MAAIEGLCKVALGPRHMEDACALVAEAGWNQTPDDWRLMINAGDAIGFEDKSGRLIASALDMPYGDAFGWISMVLVTSSWRRKGVATTLLKACIERHEAEARVPVLDATPDGEKVYVRLGFKRVFPIRRWRRTAVKSSPALGDRVRMAETADADWIVKYDREVFGGDRAAVLRDLVGREGAAGWIAEGNAGFLLSRRGRVARQLGPLCAEDDTTAGTLLSSALGCTREPIFIDVPDRHAAVIEILEEHGFTVQRPFQRMLKGEPDGFGDPTRMYVLTGPELG